MKWFSLLIEGTDLSIRGTNAICDRLGTTLDLHSKGKKKDISSNACVCTHNIN